MSPFDFVKNIKEKTGDIYNEETKGSYNPFIINRSLSMGAQTIFFANEMNRKHHLEKDLQYQFLYYGMPKNKSFDKWIKATESSDDLEAIVEYFSCSFDKAREIINILTISQLSDIKSALNKGGKSKT